MGYYVMVDRPAIRIEGSRRTRFTNKPRREHKTIEMAVAEAERLTQKTKARVLVLHVVAVCKPKPDLSEGER